MIERWVQHAATRLVGAAAPHARLSDAHAEQEAGSSELPLSHPLQPPECQHRSRSSSKPQSLRLGRTLRFIKVGV